LVASTPGYADVMRLKIDRGRFLTEADENDAKNYCVLSQGVAQILFGGMDAIGRDIYMAESKDYYQVVGILKYRPPMAGIGGSLDAQDFQGDVYVPMSTLRQRIGSLVVTRRGSQFSAEEVELSQVTLRVKQLADPQATADLVRETADIVRATFGVKNESGNPNNVSGKAPAVVTKISTDQLPTVGRRDVAVVVPEELLEQARVTRMMFMMFMGLIAAISLLVGGIGIMNIMLATVTERTREIGIRRALGATQSHIIWQFLVETISLSVVGGITGILVGLLCPVVLNAIRELLYKTAPKLMANLPEVVHRLEPQIVWGSLPLAFGISVVVGVVFGIYPAYSAAKMDPIEALRHE
jgi:putative ABC transport system permease protein